MVRRFVLVVLLSVLFGVILAALVLSAVGVSLSSDTSGSLFLSAIIYTSPFMLFFIILVVSFTVLMAHLILAPVYRK